MVLAVSTAVVTGGATLLGVIVGALVGGGVDLGLARRRERAEARSGARLVQDDLRQAEGMMMAADALGSWLEGMAVSTEAWDAHRDVLASRLRAASWDTVASAASTLKGLAVRVEREVGRSDGVWPLDSFSKSHVFQARREVFAAHNALCKLAGTAPRTDEPPRDAPPAGG